MIIVYTELEEYEALRRSLAKAGWDTAEVPGRRLAYNGVLHAIGSALRSEQPAIRIAVLYRPGTPAGVAGLITYRQAAASLEVEYLGVAVPRQGAGSALMRFVAARAAAGGVPLTVAAYATAARFYRSLGMREQLAGP